MKFYEKGERWDGRALWYDPVEKSLKMIDQRALPDKIKIISCSDYESVADAIKNMVVRGAPAIGAAAMWGMVLAASDGEDIAHAAEVLRSSRPTAYDLFFAVEMIESAIEGENPDSIVDTAIEIAASYEDDLIERCRKIGIAGSSLIQDGYGILTHCNAGALATIDYGTALSPIRIAHNTGTKLFVYVDETRPWLQGSRLTAWELEGEGIPYTIIADNAAGYYMWKGDIDMVITGADRICRNGDAANKIGTYEKAVLARENGIPFYIAAPLSTYDPDTQKGRDIVIENRDPREVLEFAGKRIAPEGANAMNPAFDIIPAKYISAYITEYGIYSPEEISDAFD